MATLQKIRNRGGLLVAIVVGLALFAFILGDMLNSGSSMFSNSQNEIAEVAGKSIPVQEYSLMVEKTVENYKRTSGQNAIEEELVEQIREQSWDQLIREYVMMDEYYEIGLGLSGEELFDMVQGNNIHPQILQIPIFKNQATGQFDRNLVIQFLKNMDSDPSGNARISWISFEKTLQEERLKTKYENLIRKGLYISNLQAEKEVTNKGRTVDVEFLQVPFSSISDSSITITDKDLNKYYEENKEAFEQTQSRDLVYVTFDVIPSEEDTKLSENWINDIYKEFVDSDNDQQFINLNSDTPFDLSFYAQGEYESASIDSFVFSSELGDVYGPYFEDGSFSIAKLSNIEFLPDSVRASHILIKPEDYNNDLARATKIVDSLKSLVETGVRFEDLARIHGTDGTADKGGDLGWFKFPDMVAPFSDSCFFAERGDIKTATTQFGVHLIKVTDQGNKSKKVQIGILERKVEPSSKTYQYIYQRASQFAGLNNTVEKFETAVDEETDLTKKVANNLGENDKRIAGLESPRTMIRWAYQAEEGDVSHVFEFGDKFVISALSEVREKGYTPIDKIESEITIAVKSEKKSELVLKQVEGKVAEGKTMQEIASELNGGMKTAAKVNFTAFSVPGLGIEPKISGTAPYLNVDEISEPLAGNLGVYLIKVTNVNEPENVDPQTEKSFLYRNISSRVSYLTFEALKERASIVDNRSQFY